MATRDHPVYALPLPPTMDAPAGVAAAIAARGPAFWQAFYVRNGARFFKDRHWLMREFGDAGLEGAATVLEVGCGVGNAARPLAAFLGPGATVYACDYAPEAVRLLAATPEAAQGKVVPFVADACVPGALVGPGRAPARGIDAATLLFALSAMEPGPPMAVAVHNVAATLRPGGRALVRDYCAGDLAQTRLAAAAGGRRLGRERLYMRGDGTRAYYFDPGELEALFRGAGFRCDRLDVVDAARENRRLSCFMQRKWVQAVFTLVGAREDSAAGDADRGGLAGDAQGAGVTAAPVDDGHPTSVQPPADRAPLACASSPPPPVAPHPAAGHGTQCCYRAEWEEEDDDDSDCSGGADSGADRGASSAASSPSASATVASAARLFRDLDLADAGSDGDGPLEEQWVDIGPPLGRLRVLAAPGDLVRRGPGPPGGG